MPSCTHTAMRWDKTYIWYVVNSGDRPVYCVIRSMCVQFTVYVSVYMYVCAKWAEWVAPYVLYICMYAWKRLEAGQTFPVVSASWGMSCANIMGHGISPLPGIQGSFPPLFSLNILYKYYRPGVSAMFALRPAGTVPIWKLNYRSELRKSTITWVFILLGVWARMLFFISWFFSRYPISNRSLNVNLSAGVCH